MNEFEPYRAYPNGPISPSFYSFATGEPFRNCIECDADLLALQEPYMIEKAVKFTAGFQDIIFEYAICEACAQSQRSKLSQDSIAMITSYLQSKSRDLGKRFYQLRDESDPENWIKSCALTGTERGELEEYVITARAVGDQLLLDGLPILMSAAVLEEMQELLSAETREELDDFVNNHFGLPPEWKEALSDKSVVLI